MRESKLPLAVVASTSNLASILYPLGAYRIVMHWLVERTIW